MKTSETINRYRMKEWKIVRRAMPEHIRQDIGEQAAPPGFVLVAFASHAAKAYVEDRLGPSLEPDRTLNIVPFKTHQRLPQE